MTAIAVETLARDFVRWHLTSGPPSWRAAFRGWPPARGLSEGELRKLRIEVLRRRTFHGEQGQVEGGAR